MTENGSCYRSAAFRKACAKLEIKHLRFIESALREWSYARTYHHSDETHRGSATVAANSFDGIAG